MFANDRRIRNEAIRGYLNAAWNALCHIGNKCVCAFLIALASVITDNQLFPSGKGKKGVKIAAKCVVGSGPALRAANLAPKLINLNCIGFNAPHQFIVQAVASGPQFAKHFHDGVRMAPGQSADSANAAALRKQFCDLDNLVMLDAQPVQRLAVGESLSASQAAIPLDNAIAIFETTEAFCFALAAMAVHLTFYGAGIK